MNLKLKIISSFKYIISNLRGDVFGGLSAGLVSIPNAIALGMLAFAPLGENYILLGAVSGISSAIFQVAFSNIFGGNPIMISGPVSSLTLIINSLLSKLILDLKVDPSKPETVTIVITLVFLTVFMAGLFQSISGFLGIGNLIKYIPYPTVAGFLNGAGILLALNQVWILCGLQKKMTIGEIWTNPVDVLPLSLIVGIIALITIITENPISKRMPPPLAGLVIGSIVYYSLYFTGFSDKLGPIIGEIKTQIPRPEYIGKFIDIFVPANFPILIQILPISLILTVLMTLESLLNGLAVENVTQIKVHRNREIVGQGIGNMIAAIFGGIAGAGAASRSMINYKSGGRTQLSGFFAGLFVFVIMLYCTPIVKLIPQAVMAAILCSTAYNIIDRWSLKLLVKAVSKQLTAYTEAVLNILVVFVVTATAVFVNIIFSVLVGLMLGLLLLLTKRSKSLIRRQYYGGKVFSRKQRDAKMVEILTSEGKKVLILELEGYIFFSSADNLASEVEKHSNEIAFLIMDMKRVGEVDITGARVLEKIHKILQEKNVELYISNVDQNGPIWNFLKDMGIINSLGMSKFFPDTDFAMEKAEDILIEKFLDGMKATLAVMPERGPKTEELAALIDEMSTDEREIPIEKIDLFKGISKKDFSVLKKHLKSFIFKKGDFVFRQGDQGNELFVITKGSASVTININQNKKKRLVTFSPGTIFGEMALLDGKPRSANIEAAEELVCYSLSLKDFQFLEKKHPSISIVLLKNLSYAITNRLRMQQMMISELEG